MGGKKNGKGKAIAALHAEGAKAGLDHDALHEEAAAMGYKSLRDVPAKILRAWANRLRRRHPGYSSVAARRNAGRAGRGDRGAVAELVDGETLKLVEGYMDALGWSREALDRFIERQLGGRRQIRTTADANTVIDGMRAIYRRRKKAE